MGLCGSSEQGDFVGINEKVKLIVMGNICDCCQAKQAIVLLCEKGVSRVSVLCRECYRNWELEDLAIAKGEVNEDDLVPVEPTVEETEHVIRERRVVAPKKEPIKLEPGEEVEFVFHAEGDEVKKEEETKNG